MTEIGRSILKRLMWFFCFIFCLIAIGGTVSLIIGALVK